MEKGGVCRNMKQMHGFKLKVSSMDYSSSVGEVDFAWPPRSYVCSFCKREFRSAQALGGHMNVHRRDRARLRQSPAGDYGGGEFSPLLNLNLDPNPSFCSNPSLCPPLSSLSTKFPQFSSTMPPPTQLRRCAAVESFKPIITKDFMKLKAVDDRFDSGFVQLDLGIGLMSPYKEELDLELRLGYT